MSSVLGKPMETKNPDAAAEKRISPEKRGGSIPEAPERGISHLLETLSEVGELSLERALLLVGGSGRVFERIIKLSVRLLPENINRMSELFETDPAGYSIEVHGMKSVLNNIGAYEMGSVAEQLEEASRRGGGVCKEIHNRFIERLTAFSDLMSGLLEEAAVHDKPPGDKELLLKALPEIREAAEYFDSALALEMLAPAREHGYGESADKAIENLARAFEQFDFEAALELSGKLEQELSANVDFAG